MAKYFKSADILLPDACDMTCWAVIACDQFTSNPAYWQRVRKLAEGVPSTLHMILPEAELESADAAVINQINDTMQKYLEKGIFHVYHNSYIYMERTLHNGMIRQGIVGMIDLEHYAYDPAQQPMISATESTVLERIPPRVAIRRDAPIELPHVLLLCQDENKQIIEAVAARKDSLPKLYEFDLMEGGGHIAGWLLQGSDAEPFEAALAQYEADQVYLVGDGNHSLVTAKTCYENYRANGETDEHPSRYALVELENIYSQAMMFEPIHRVITDTDPAALLHDIHEICDENGVAVRWVTAISAGEIKLAVPEGELTVGVLQNFLDNWLSKNAGKIDYIHDADALTALAQTPNAIGFLLPPMPKHALFPFVRSGRTLPRKTFSLGHSTEKRYYLEGRKIK